MVAEQVLRHTTQHVSAGFAHETAAEETLKKWDLLLFLRDERFIYFGFA